MQYNYGVVLIDYNSADRTNQYIHDLFLSVDIYPSIIVIIDNYIESDKTDSIVSRFNMREINLSNCLHNKSFIKLRSYMGKCKGSYVYLLKTGENLGYAKGNNLGIELLRFFKIDYALISNSDIVFKDKVNISQFCNVMIQDKSIIGVGSDVFRIDGTRQSPCRYLSIYDRWWRGKIFWPLTKFFYRCVDETIAPENDERVYRLIGAFFMVSIDLFFCVGGFDEHTFMYGEELILSERAARKSLNFYYIKGNSVYHEDGYTVNCKILNNRKILMQLDSDLYYYNNYRRTIAVICLITNIIVRSYLFKNKLANHLIDFFTK